MRKLIVGGCIFLILSGLILHYGEYFEIFTGYSAISALHIWAGIFFIVIFPMYAWDHIRTHRKRLKKMSWVSGSGIIQLLSGVVLILSGIVLLLFGTNKLALSTELHFVPTFFLAASLFLHSLIKK
ncbi:MAG: hypothetical protein HQM13_11925 [SAR324 cluster bacterium]|nr:hypothetical protein [SAR324 cluster bacterium]